jgi:hypothetical protein
VFACPGQKRKRPPISFVLTPRPVFLPRLPSFTARKTENHSKGLISRLQHRISRPQNSLDVLHSEVFTPVLQGRYMELSTKHRTKKDNFRNRQ